jgi:hypothetical protein
MRFGRAVAGVVLAGGAMLLGLPGVEAAAAATGHVAAASGDLGVAARSVKERYGVGEAVALTVTATNSGETACRMASVPDGTVRVSGVTRDGATLAPSYGRARYLDGYLRLVTSNSAEVRPGDTVTVPLESAEVAGVDGPVLPVVDPMPTDDGLVALWPVGAAGRYVVTLAYQMPRSEAGACAGSGSATVSFEVAAPGTQAGFPLRWVLIGLGVLVLLGVAVLVVWLTRRRRRGPAVLLLVALGAAALVVDARTADAKILVQDHNFEVSACFAQFRTVGGETAKILDFLSAENGPVVAIKTVNTKRSDGIWDIETFPLDPRTEGRVGSRIFWRPDVEGMKFGDGVPVEKCSALLHEMAHAYANADYANDDRRCSLGYSISVEEARATLAENTYREAMGLPQRTVHGKDKVPPSLNECHPSKASRKIFKTPGVQCFGVDAKRCGINDGDPHLTTYDGRRYDFQAVGEFVNTRATTGDLEIQTRQTAAFSSRTVSVNSAVAAKVGPDRVGVYLGEAALTVKINGRDTAVGAKPVKLPGGGVVTAVEARNPAYGSGYTVTWPDGSLLWADPIGSWGIAVFSTLSPARQGKVTGLLGDFDGNQDNDLGGREPSFEQLYREFGESWRVTPRSTLFDYDAGKDTAVYTDRGFPDRPVTLADLPADRRDRATALCQALGVTEPAQLDSCTLDVAETGQTAFAIGSSASHELTVEPTQTGTTVPAGGVLRDGDTASGALTRGQVVTYPLDASGVVRLYDVPDNLKVSLVGTSGTEAEVPGFTITSGYLWRLKPGGSYQLEVSAPDRDSGPYNFRVVGNKERRLPVSVGAQVTGKLDVPGRIDLYQISSATPVTIRLTGGSPCDGVVVAFVDDGPAPRAYTPLTPCYDIPMGDLEPGKRYLIVVWSGTGKPADYRFTVSG